MLRDKNLVGAGGGLRPGRRVDDGSDRSQVAMRAAELRKTEFARANADAYADSITLIVGRWFQKDLTRIGLY